MAKIAQRCPIVIARTREANAPADTAASAYTYPAGNATRPHTPLSIAGRQHTYDANGNTLSDGLKTLVWANDNRLKSVINSGATTSFLYGPDGARATKTTNDTGASVTTRYFGPEAEEKGGTFTRYPQMDVIVETTGNLSTIKFMHRDHLVSFRLVTKTDSNGAPASGLPLTGGADIVQEQNRYAAFGEPKVVSSLSKGYIPSRRRFAWLPGKGTNAPTPKPACNIFRGDGPVGLEQLLNLVFQVCV